MATPWPQQPTWPSTIREHAACISTYLHSVLKLVERTGDQTIPANIAIEMIRASLTYILKTQNIPDMTTIRDALNMAQTEAKTTANNLTQALSEIKNDLKNTTEIVQQSAANIQLNANTAEEARAAAKEATEVGKATMEITREIRNKKPQEQVNRPMTYAAAVASDITMASMYNTQSLKTPFAQTQREVILNIRDPLTVQSLRAMNPQNLKAHVERAIEQSKNENIAKVRVVSSNQLKSGDLSIKTTSSMEVEALRQFADVWAHRIGSGTSVQIPTYGVLVHGIRTSTMDMNNFEENKNQILHDNRPFIPRAEIRHIGWLTREASAKTATSITIEFTKPEDANKIIDEGLIWQGEVFQCERYERQCRMKQCYKCQRYGHIGPQCKAAITCGYCAQEHNTRDCPSKSGQDVPRKCAACRGAHEAWSRQCPTRKEEIAKAKSAYETRPRYHYVANTIGHTVQPETSDTTARRSRPNQTTTSAQTTQTTRNRSQSGREQNRNNDETANGQPDRDSQPTQGGGSQRPQRNIVRTRRGLRAGVSYRTRNTQNSQRTDVDSDTEA